MSRTHARKRSAPPEVDCGEDSDHRITPPIADGSRSLAGYDRSPHGEDSVGATESQSSGDSVASLLYVKWLLQKQEHHSMCYGNNKAFFAV